MKIPGIKNLTFALGRVSLKVKKHSPTILTGVAALGVVGTAVTASTAGVKASYVLTDAKEYKFEIEATDFDSKSEYAKEVLHLHGATSLELVKVYLPTIVVGGVTIASLVGSHQIMFKRNLALTGAYVALDNFYREYRKNVIEEFGVNNEQKVYDKTKESVKESHLEEHKNGDKPIEYIDPDPYSRFFDEFSPNWIKDSRSNLAFLRMVELQANDNLKARGHIFLNEVFDAIGIPRTPAGSVTGWLLDSVNGDSFVDFGLRRGRNDAVDAFLDGEERSVQLNFNCEGVIYDKI